jgi:predicted transcriptional regulator
MLSKCEVIGKYILPVFRALVAKELLENHNFTQVKTAEILGTTQAAISQYINSKRAYRGIKELDEFMPKIKTIAENTANRIASGELKPEEITVDLCAVCSACSQKIKLSLHHARAKPLTSKPSSVHH